jgi:hypothetical protein
MTDEQINAAIAEACGLKKPSRKVKLNDKGFFVTQHAKLPNYCTDLNAMHKAEAMLSNANMYVMEVQLKYVLSAREFYFHATARQRAEAFLRTLGLWKEALNG